MAAGVHRKWFDAHCHVQDPRYGTAADDVIAAAEAAGVERMAVNGCCEDDWGKVRELAERHPDAVHPSFGLHPWFVEGRSADWLQRLQEALEAVPHAGLGECGLDKIRRKEVDMETQEAVFQQQLRLGKRLRRPIAQHGCKMAMDALCVGVGKATLAEDQLLNARYEFLGRYAFLTSRVHCVRAFGRLLEMLQAEGPFPAGLVLHSWGGHAELVAPFAAIGGVHFSISGHLTQLPTEKAAAMLKEIPFERLLLETDAPDGLPQLRDAELARKVEAAAGCRLQVLLTELEVKAAGCGETKPSPTAAELPLDWWLPLDVSLRDSQGSRRVESPKQLLNHPANVRVVAHMVAILMERDVAQAAAAAFANAERLFGKRMC